VPDGEELSLAELSARMEIPPRTIRFYIAQGLLPGPLRSGRGAAYGSVHLGLLNRIKQLQARGMTLAEVTFALAPERSHRTLPEPVSWLEYQLAEDVAVRIRSDIAPWRHKAIRTVLAEASAKLQEKSEKGETK
jgi:DNA-binding transcriptional MerR regulator